MSNSDEVIEVEREEEAHKLPLEVLETGESVLVGRREGRSEVVKQTTNQVEGKSSFIDSLSRIELSSVCSEFGRESMICNRVGNKTRMQGNAEEELEAVGRVDVLESE